MKFNFQKISNIIPIFIVSIFILVISSETCFSFKTIPESFTKLADQARPTVVNIRAVKTIQGGGRVFRHFFGKPFGRKDPFEDFFGPFLDKNPNKDHKQRSLGSGFIIDKEGYIVTNNHVVEDADKIKVKLSNEEEFDATIVGRDAKTDLAVLKIDAPKNLKAINLGDSEELKVGSWVVAIGSPFGLEQTVTAGIVSAKGRIIGSGPYDNFIQTDASINPGNSGGPLINMKGEVIGINTAIIASGQGIGFAIPINLAKRIINQLKESGEVTRGWLGVVIQDLSKELADYYNIKNKKGVLVIQVMDEHPADKAGVTAKDVIVAVDGKAVSTTRELSRIIADSDVGKRVTLTIYRQGKIRKIKVKLSKRDDTDNTIAKSSEGNKGLGFSVSELSPEIANRLGYDEDDRGVVVVRVYPDSKGEEAGIREGDLVKEVNHVSIDDLRDYRSQMGKIKPRKDVQLLIKRPMVGFLVIKFTS